MPGLDAAQFSARCRQSELQALSRSLHVLGMLLLAVECGCDSRAVQNPGSGVPVAASAPFDARPLPRIPVAQRPEAGDGPNRTVLKFEEIAAESRVHFTRFDDHSARHRIIEVNGGGVALFDFDGDGRTDIFFTNGCRLPLSLNDRSHDLALFRNLGELEFAEVAGPARLNLHHGYYSGCTVGDYNSDGFDDLFVEAFGPDLFLRNNGDGTFADVTQETGAGSDLWGSSPAFADLDRDGNLDLVVVNYLLATDDSRSLCPEPKSPDGYAQCAPSFFAGAPSALFMSDGAGGFVDATLTSGFTGADGKGLGILIFDMDRDGDDDIFVANDGTPNFFYRNSGLNPAAGISTIRFEECAAAMGCAVNAEAKPLAGMGVASGDYNCDGWRDILVTNFYAETSTLYRNVEGTGFTDDTARSGVGRPSRDKTGFGTEFVDLDNDGLLDLVVTNGHVDDFEWRSPPEPYRMLPQVFHNQGDRLIEVSTGAGPYFHSRWIGRGLAIGDLDGDGLLDVVISHQRAPSAVLHNRTASEYRSVILKLVGTGKSNRSAFGTLVEAVGLGRVLVREVVGGGSFQSASDRRVHFGLAKGDRIPLLRIKWPSGQVDEWTDVVPGEYILREGARFPEAPLQMPLRSVEP